MMNNIIKENWEIIEQKLIKNMYEDGEFPLSLADEIKEVLEKQIQPNEMTITSYCSDDKSLVWIDGVLYQKAKFDFPEGTQTVSVKRPRFFNQQNGGWIPCSERQPDKTDNYLAYCESSDGTATLTFINVEHYNSGNDWTGFYKGQKKRREVIAWQPLPEPYCGK